MSHIVDVCMIAGAEGTLTSFEPHSVIKWYQIAQKLPDSLLFFSRLFYVFWVQTQSMW